MNTMRSHHRILLPFTMLLTACAVSHELSPTATETDPIVLCSTAQPWATGTAYAVGELVTYGGKTYKCIQAHTSEPGWIPDVVAALWSPVPCSRGGSGSGGSPGGGSSSGGGSGSDGGCSSSGSGGSSSEDDFMESFSTWYCGNACGMDDTGSCGTTYCGTHVGSGELSAALSENRMNGPSGVYMGGGLCGKQIEIVVLDTGASITVPVEDACEACNADDHVDLTLDVWQALGVDPCAGTFRQKWRFVD